MDCIKESLDDIPLIVSFCKRLKIDQLVEEYFSTHGNQKGLSNGLLALSWITHILTKGDHRKSPVQEWAQSHMVALQALLENQLTYTDFDDTRLGRFLDKLADDEAWQNFEKAFYKDCFCLLNLPVNGLKTIKIDSTSAYGYHKEKELMKYGYSKDKRPDLPQLKLMVSVEGSSGYQIAVDTVAGNINDDILYIPIIERTRKIVETKQCLYCGDSKMSSQSIRANIVSHSEFYLTPLQLSNVKIRQEFKEWVNNITNGQQEAQLIYDEAGKLLGAGYEIKRMQQYQDKVWEERVLIVRSSSFAEQELSYFDKKLDKLIKSLQGQSSKTCKSEEEAKEHLQNKLRDYLRQESLSNLLDFEIEVIHEVKEHKRTEKRNGKIRQGSYKTQGFRATIGRVKINEEKLDELRREIGFRLYVTNVANSDLSLSQAYCYFRQTMYVIEIGFHTLKDYFQISPLFVREERQIKGLTRLLMLALRILTLMTAEIRANMKKANIILQGLYAGQSARKHSQPTAESILEYFCRKEPALIGFKLEDQWIWKTTSLPDMCKSILNLLKLDEHIYDNLSKKIMEMGLKN